MQPPRWGELQADLADACHLPDAAAFHEALLEAPPEVDQDHRSQVATVQQQLLGAGVAPRCL